MSGGTLAVVPIRSLTAGKTRLAGAVDTEARAELIRLMLSNVLRSLSESDVIDQIAVISPEPAALALAANQIDAAELLAQPREVPGLLPALEIGRAHALTVAADALVIVFGDLPRLSAADVSTLVDSPAEVVVAPDRARLGTNALLLRGRAISAFPFRFGERSFPAHLAEADQLQLRTEIVEREGLSFDLDTPGDLPGLPVEMTTATTWMTAL